MCYVWASFLHYRKPGSYTDDMVFHKMVVRLTSKMFILIFKELSINFAGITGDSNIFTLKITISLLGELGRNRSPQSVGDRGKWGFSENGKAQR